MTEAFDERIEVGGDELWIGIVLAAFRIDAEDAAARGVAERRLVSVSAAVLGVVAGRFHVGSRVVLDDEIIPVSDPDRAVGAGFRKDRAGPAVGAGIKIVR